MSHLKWPTCHSCVRELELIRPHTFEECYCIDFYCCSKCHVALIKRENAIIKDEKNLLCHSCYIKSGNPGTL